MNNVIAKFVRTAVLPAAITAGLLLSAAPAVAFDFSNLEDLKKVGKAVSIGSKAMKANREINQEEEIRIGDGVAARVLGTAPLVDNAALQKYVNRVGRWLAMQTERPDLPWRFGVIASDDVNAFSTPGGTILITRGMYSRFRNEGELAGVLAHEIAHVLERHQLKQIQKSLGNEWKMELVNAVAEDKGNGDAKNIAKAFSAGTEIFTRGLDKQDEFAADRQGVVIAARAGYNPYGLVSVLQTLGDINAQDSAVALMFKTHPSPSVRLDMLADAMGEKLDDYAGQVESTKRFIPLKAEAASDADREQP
ncbi:MAG: M48 family metalloprotease [Pseudomonadota bacterium]